MIYKHLNGTVLIQFKDLDMDHGLQINQYTFMVVSNLNYRMFPQIAF